MDRQEIARSRAVYLTQFEAEKKSYSTLLLILFNLLGEFMDLSSWLVGALETDSLDRYSIRTMLSIGAREVEGLLFWQQVLL